MNLVFVFVLVTVLMGIPSAYSQTSNTLSVRYSDGYAEPFEIIVEPNQNYLLSQEYSWVRDQSSRYNLVSYSLDGGDIVQIDRNPRGSFTLDIQMEGPHLIMFFAVPQFPLTVNGISNYEYDPKSTTGDNWFDSNSEIQVKFPSIEQRTQNERHVVSKWVLDNTAVSYASGDEGALLTDLISMTDSHKLDVYTKTQYMVDVVSDYGEAFGGGWYDLGANVTIGVTAPAELFAKKFERWGGQDNIPNENPTTIMIDSAKKIDAVWTDVFVAPALITVSGIAAVAIMVMRHRKPRTKQDQYVTSDGQPQNEYSFDIDEFLRANVSAELESYVSAGLIDVEKYQRIKNNL